MKRRYPSSRLKPEASRANSVTATEPTEPTEPSQAQPSPVRPSQPSVPDLPGQAVPAQILDTGEKVGPVADTGGTVDKSWWSKFVDLFR